MPHIRITSKSGRYIALIPAEALDPHGPAIGFSVVVTSNGVSSFAASWPCSHLNDSPIRFEFASNGDLVDIQGEPRNADGGAMVALSADAQGFGEKVIERRRALPWPPSHAN